MIGQTISHYKIIEKLGEGGMGVVYRAEDTRLMRTVALKFLPLRHSSSEQDKARFLQEAQAASALNHPNVCTIYDIQQEGDQHFIAMEFVDGVTLREKMGSGNRKLDTVLPLAIQIGEALQEAHANGIVHRDIKSDNIMVNSKNQIKVMDFGLAKLKGSLKLTRSSSTVGTLGYMAPEQIQGGEVDARSDIFSFGVLLFEMLTGRLPFRGEHEAAMMYSILNEEPESLANILPDASPELIHLFNKSTEKDPEDRYQTVGEMVVDLRRMKKDSTKVHRTSAQVVRPEPVVRADQARAAAIPAKSIAGKKGLFAFAAVMLLIASALLLKYQPWKSAGSETGKRTLAVLPFENQGDAEKEYFADGITDEITSRLSRLSGLGVIARSSAKEYKKSTKPLKQIGEELGVDYVLMGTVRWSGEKGNNQRVRISPELIQVSNSIQTWSQPFEADFSDAFKIQSDIASEVVRALDVQLLQTEEQSLGEKLTTNAAAYDFYLKGLEYDSRGFAKEDIESAIQMFQRAIEEDPGFAAAYAWLSQEHSGMYWFFHDRTEARVQQALGAADKALALNPRLSEAHSAKARYYYHCRLDYANALAEYDIALKYGPNNSDVTYGMAAVKRRQGKMLESVELFRKTVEVNPRAQDMIRQLGETLTLARKYDEAEAAYDRAILLAPDLEYGYATKAVNTLLLTGDVNRAVAIADSGIERNKTKLQPVLLASRARVLWYSNDYDRAMRAVDGLAVLGEVTSQFGYLPLSLMRGMVEHTMGSPKSAIAYLDSARRELETKIHQHPEDERFHSSLGIAYAGLGRKEDAIREGLKGVELLPVEKEAWRGSFRLADLARIYTIVGETDKAIDIFEKLLLVPSEISKAVLRIDPACKTLRSNPRFQKLITEK